MKTLPVIVWRMQSRSLRNALRHDPRMLFGLGITSVFAVISGGWSSLKLLTALHLWQAQGSATLNSGLWHFCLSVWLGMSFFTLIGVQRAVNSDETLLLFTLPIPPAMHFRALAGAFFIENLWLLTLLQAFVTAYVLISALGWHAFSWLLVLQVGILLAVGVSMFVTLLVLCYVLPRERSQTRLWLLSLLALLVGSVGFFHSPLNIIIQRLLLWLRPEFMLLLFVGILCIVWGPCAELLGQLYQRAFLIAQERDRGRKAFTLPGTRILTGLLEGQRGLSWGLFTKAVISQSRNWFFWARLLMTWGLLTFFLPVRAFLTHSSLTDPILVAGYVAALILLQIIETAPGAISGEGNRLALYLTAPWTKMRLLTSKLTLFLLPVLLEGFLMCLILAGLLHFSVILLSWSLLACGLVVLGGTILLVWGSSWDADLNLAVEGLMESIMQEEVPLTPRKLLLLVACLIFFALALFILWWFPVLSGLLLLTGLDIAVMIGMWYFAQAQLRRLVRQG